MDGWITELKIMVAATVSVKLCCAVALVTVAPNNSLFKLKPETYRMKN